jgi:hypothetical protein
MITVLLVAAYVATLLFVVALCRAASRPAPSPPLGLSDAQIARELERFEAAYERGWLS